MINFFVYILGLRQEIKLKERESEREMRLATREAAMTSKENIAMYAKMTEDSRANYYAECNSLKAANDVEKARLDTSLATIKAEIKALDFTKKQNDLAMGTLLNAKDMEIKRLNDIILALTKSQQTIISK